MGIKLLKGTISGRPNEIWINTRTKRHKKYPSQ